MKRLFFILITLIMVSCQVAREEESPAIPSYGELANYSRNILDDFLADVTGNQVNMEEVLQPNTSIRSFTRKAEGLLYRNQPGDVQNATRILEWVLSYQNKNEESETYGVFKTEPEDEGFPDENWREFVGSDLINIHAHPALRNLLSNQMVKAIENALLMAAEGAMERDVTHYYSNISIMSAFLMEYAGVIHKREDLINFGRQKAQDVFALYKKCGNAFSEFNSPTYYGVNMVALATWRKLGQSDSIRNMGSQMEAGLWKSTANFYHPEMKTMVGPYFRSYGMDMMRYNAIIGLWIGMAFNDETLAPWPGKAGGKYGEVSNIVPAVVLGVEAPQSILPKFRAFQKARFIEKNILNLYDGEEEKHVTAYINESWMMGGVTGIREDWVQVVPGTIFWQQLQSRHPGWLLVPGPSQADVLVNKESMHIMKGGAKEEMVFLLHVNNLDIATLSGDVWELPGINLHISSELGAPRVEIIGPDAMQNYFANADGLEKITKITFPMQGNENASDTLVTIKPEKPENI